MWIVKYEYKIIISYELENEDLPLSKFASLKCILKFYGKRNIYL